MLSRRDAVLYVAASGFSSFGLGITAFYLNFLYRGLLLPGNKEIFFPQNLDCLGCAFNQ